jgi:prophage regulatory protein
MSNQAESRKGRRKPSQQPVPILDHENRLVTVREVLARIPVSRPTLYRMVRESRFPKPLQLTPTRIAWRWSDVLAWLHSRSTDTIRKPNLDRRHRLTRRHRSTPTTDTA